MEQRFETISPKKLVGKRLQMSFSEDRTDELWRSFMTERKLINNALGSDLYSMQIYSPNFFLNFNPDKEFEKWATVEVPGFDLVPGNMETFTLTGGLYAVFQYKGASSAGASAFQYILGTWLPASGYILDDRPHFEILGNKYKNSDPESEEEIWIPITFPA